MVGQHSGKGFAAYEEIVGFLRRFYTVESLKYGVQYRSRASMHRSYNSADWLESGWIRPFIHWRSMLTATSHSRATSLQQRTDFGDTKFLLFSSYSVGVYPSFFFSGRTWVDGFWGRGRKEGVENEKKNRSPNIGERRRRREIGTLNRQSVQSHHPL